MIAVARRIVGALLFLTGVVWIGQGLGWISGSFMTGSTFWAVTGGVCVVVALVLSAGRGGSPAARTSLAGERTARLVNRVARVLERRLARIVSLARSERQLESL